MKELRSVVPILLALVLGGCLGQGTKPTTAPANFQVTPGESQVVLSWTDDPALTYWIYYKANSTTTGIGNADQILYQVTSPYDLTGLTNGTQYAFAVTASDNGSEVGPFTPALTATPRPISSTTPWVVGMSLTPNNLNSIAFGNNEYVAVGNAATIYSATYDYTSPSGVQSSTGSAQPWNAATTVPLSTSVNLTGVIYDGAQFVALGDDGSIITSTDGLTWTAATAITGVSGMNAITSGNGVYVAVGNGGVIELNSNAAVGGAWTAPSSHTTQNLYGVAFLNGQFVAVGAQGTVLTSPDGTTWTVRAAPASVTANALRSVAYGAGLYVAVGDAGTVVSSSDGATWTPESTTVAGGQSLNSIAFGPDTQFLAVGGTAGTVIYSQSGTDGSWSTGNTGANQVLYGIAPNAVYIAVGAAGANVSVK